VLPSTSNTVSLLPASLGGGQTLAGGFSPPRLPSASPGCNEETWHPGFGGHEQPKDASNLLFFNGIEKENVAPWTAEGDIRGELTGSSWSSQPCFSSSFPLVTQAFIFDTALIRQVRSTDSFPLRSSLPRWCHL